MTGDDRRDLLILIVGCLVTIAVGMAAARWIP